MRPSRWFWTVDRLRRKVEDGMAAVDLECSGRIVTGRVTALLDRRFGPVRSGGRTCLNHPDLRDHDGLIADVGSELQYLSAAQLADDFLDRPVVIDRRPLWSIMPGDCQRLLLMGERRLIENDHRYPSDLAWYHAYRNAISIVEQTWENCQAEFDSILREAQFRPWQALKRGRSLIGRQDFQYLAALAETANHCAKYTNAAVRPDLRRGWYQLKNDCINRLLVGWYAEPNGFEHLELCCPDRSALANIYVALTFPSLGHQVTIAGRMLHIAPRLISPDGRAAILARQPELASLFPPRPS